MLQLTHRCGHVTRRQLQQPWRATLRDILIRHSAYRYKHSYTTVASSTTTTAAQLAHALTPTTLAHLQEYGFAIVDQVFQETPPQMTPSTSLSHHASDADRLRSEILGLHQQPNIMKLNHTHLVVTPNTHQTSTGSPALPSPQRVFVPKHSIYEADFSLQLQLMDVNAPENSSPKFWYDFIHGRESIDALNRYFGSDLQFAHASVKAQVCSGDGGCFPLHFDTDRKIDSRRITAVLYLNPDWDMQRDGGGLRLYTFPHPAVDISPRHNRLVLFDSHRTLHRVLPSKRQRICISFWYWQQEQQWKEQLLRASSPPFDAVMKQRLESLRHFFLDATIAQLQTLSQLLNTSYLPHLAKLFYTHEWFNSLEESHPDSDDRQSMLVKHLDESDMIERAFGGPLRTLPQRQQAPMQPEGEGWRSWFPIPWSHPPILPPHSRFVQPETNSLSTSPSAPIRPRLVDWVGDDSKLVPPYRLPPKDLTREGIEPNPGPGSIDHAHVIETNHTGTKSVQTTNLIQLSSDWLDEITTCLTLNELLTRLGRTCRSFVQLIGSVRCRHDSLTIVDPDLYLLPTLHPHPFRVRSQELRSCFNSPHRRHITTMDFSNEGASSGWTDYYREQELATSLQDLSNLTQLLHFHIACGPHHVDAAPIFPTQLQTLDLSFNPHLHRTHPHLGAKVTWNLAIVCDTMYTLSHLACLTDLRLDFTDLRLALKLSDTWRLPHSLRRLCFKIHPLSPLTRASLLNEHTFALIRSLPELVYFNADIGGDSYGRGSDAMTESELLLLTRPSDVSLPLQCLGEEYFTYLSSNKLQAIARLTNLRKLKLDFRGRAIQFSYHADDVALLRKFTSLTHLDLFLCSSDQLAPAILLDGLRLCSTSLTSLSLVNCKFSSDELKELMSHMKQLRTLKIIPADKNLSSLDFLRITHPDQFDLTDLHVDANLLNWSEVTLNEFGGWTKLRSIRLARHELDRYCSDRPELYHLYPDSPSFRSDLYPNLTSFNDHHRPPP